jgi:hypothetical protein
MVDHMTWFPYLEFDPKKGLIDAFGRQRIANPQTLFASKYSFDEQAVFWDDQETSGSGTGSSHSTDTASVTLSVSATTAGVRVRQTYRWFPYQPGKSQLIMMTGVLGDGASGIIKRLGYFNANNGIFFETDGTTVNVVRRTYVTGSAVDNEVAQASWNIDPLDGSGDSGITVDFTKTQIFLIDFEWLGVGRVRIGFVIDGVIYYCHEFLNANTLADVYMSTGNLPIRVEIQNDGTGAADSIETICNTVISEGGSEKLGQIRSISRGTTNLTTQNDTNIYPLISIRLKSTHLGAMIIPESFSILCTSTADYETFLLLNPTVAGTDAVSWTDLTNTSIQYDVSRDNTNTLSGGTRIYGEIGTSTNQSASAPGSSAEPHTLLLGSDISGARDELVLAVRNLSAGAEDYYAVMNVRDIQ